MQVYYFVAGGIILEKSNCGKGSFDATRTDNERCMANIFCGSMPVGIVVNALSNLYSLPDLHALSYLHPVIRQQITFGGNGKPGVADRRS
jgi:hypothetical protein